MSTVHADRLADERAFHDAQATRRARSYAADPRRYARDLATYRTHAPWVGPALDLVGDVAGKRVLDTGCGHGIAATLFALAGAEVAASDLSPGYVAEAVGRARVAGARVRGVVAAGESLPFPDASFDAVWCHAVFHHLEREAAASELARVLAPSGVVVMCEPFDGNPLVRLTRRRLPYPGKAHTPGEAPLTLGDLRELRRHFREVSWQSYQLFGASERLGVRLPGAAALDRFVLSRVPFCRNLGRYVVARLSNG